MKKLLVGTAAIALGLAMSAPAKAADGVKLGVGGYFKGYASWVDQDETTGVSVDSFDILRDTEVHFTGETTLDNGLTVGFHTELEDDQGDGFNVNESYAYFSGAWGRTNFGAEDGAAYLLQVAAPSADSNVDGLRQYISGTNFGNIGDTGTAVSDLSLQDLLSGNVAEDDAIYYGAALGAGGDDIRVGAAGAGLGFTGPLDYAHDDSGQFDKFTYLSPVFSGFQGGVSYSPNTDNAGDGSDGNFTRPHPVDNAAGSYGDVWDVALRWEGNFNNVGIAAGGGYSHTSFESNGAYPANVVAYRDLDNDAVVDAGEAVASLEDVDTWNAGLDLNYGAFGLGAAYLTTDSGVSNGFDRDTWTVGADYTTGPYKLGLTYFNTTQDIMSKSIDVDRWTGGVVYTYGPGMTFRGSVSWLDAQEDFGDNTTVGGVDGANSTNVVLGTQIDF